jgi:hypothetical protein
MHVVIENVDFNVLKSCLYSELYSVKASTWLPNVIRGLRLLFAEEIAFDIYAAR